MIFTTISGALFLVFEFFISLFPDMGVTDIETMNRIHSSFSDIRMIIAWANWWFPVDTMFFVLSSMIGLYILIYGLSLGRWIINILSPLPKNV